MSFVIQIFIGLFALIMILYFIYLIYNIPQLLNFLRNDIQLPGRVRRKDRVDCNQNVTYCFNDSHCSQLCTNNNGSICRNGICVDSNVLNTETPLNECNAERGVLTFFVGNVALGRYDFLCRSVDLGIAPDDPNLENNMCMNGDINIDYTRAFPMISECSCPEGKLPVVLPETSQVRSYVQCIDEFQANRII